MWRAILALTVQRFLLLSVAFLAINLQLDRSQGGGVRIRSWNEVKPILLSLTERLDEWRELEESRTHPATQVLSVSKNPVVWLSRVLADFLRWPSASILILVSNLLFLWFLWSLNSLFNHLAMPDEASDATILAALWVTSYEFSLGSSVVFFGLASTWCLQGALDNRWWLAGIGVAGLLLQEPVGVAYLPYLLMVFFYFQRHFMLSQILKNSLFLLVPAVVVSWWRWDVVSHIASMWDHGSVMTILNQLSMSQFDWFWQSDQLAQTLTILFFLGSAILLGLVSRLFVHVLIPITGMGALLALMPFGQVASRSVVAMVCLLGPAVMMSKPLGWIMRCVFVGLSVYEVAHLLAAK